MNTERTFVPWDVKPDVPLIGGAVLLDRKPEKPKGWKLAEAIGNAVAARAEAKAIVSLQRTIDRAPYTAYRRATRFWRRSFTGQTAAGQRTVVRHQLDAQRSLVKDGERVGEYVRFHLGGVEDVVKISQGLGMKRGRVRLILAKGLAR